MFGRKRPVAHQARALLALVQTVGLRFLIVVAAAGHGYSLIEAIGRGFFLRSVNPRQAPFGGALAKPEFMEKYALNDYSAN